MQKEQVEGQKIRIIITDDNAKFSEALAILLNNIPGYEVIDICSNGKELVESKHLHTANLLLLDIDMPVMNGLEAAEQINRRSKVPMSALTMHVDKVYLLDIVQAGFQGFVSKTSVGHSIKNTIEQVLNNRYVFPKDLKIK
ncbi:MAG: response regulator transcription factor [Bacteroidales bacterium]|nr:response regulator transcription factor [Bacteroidales bacterium]